MGLVAAKATAQTGTAVVGTTIDVPLDLGGLTPKVVWVEMVGRTETVDAVAAGNTILSVGFGVSPSSVRCMSGFYTNGGPSSATGRMLSDNAIVVALNGTTNAGALTINALSANNLQLIVTVQFATSFTLLVRALAGSDITNASCVSWNHTSGTGAQSITTVGHPARYVETLGAGHNAANSGVTEFITSIGRAYIPDVANQHRSSRATQAVSPSQNFTYANDTEHHGFVFTALDGRYTVDGSLSNGFTINKIESTSFSPRLMFSLVLDGTFRCKLGSSATATSTSTDITFDPGFSPVLSYVFSHSLAKSTTDTRQTGHQFSSGSFLGQFGSLQSCIAFNNPSGANPMQSDTAIRFADVYANTNGTGTVQGAMRVVSPAALPPTAVTMRMSVADPSAFFFGWASFGSTAPTADVVFIADVQTFATGTGTGIQSFSMPNLLAAGEPVKAIRVYACGYPNGGDPSVSASAEGDVYHSYGFGVASGAQVAYANFIDDAAATSACGRGRLPGAVLLTVDATGAQTGAASWIPTNAAGDVTLNFTDGFPTDHLVVVEAFGGSSITNAKVIGFDRTTGTGDLVVTTGIMARYGEVLNGQMAAGTNGAADALFSLGRFWVPDLSNHVVAFADDGGLVGSTNSSSYGTDGEVCADLAFTGGAAFGGRAAVSAGDTTTVTLNRIESGTTFQMHMMVLEGMFSGALGSFQTRTDNVAFGPGAGAFTHQSESLLSVCAPSKTADTSVDSANFSVGAYAPASYEGAHAFNDIDGLSPSIASRGFSGDNGLYINAGGGAFGNRTGEGTYSIASGDSDTNWVFYAFLGNMVSGSSMALQMPRSWLNRNSARGY